MQQQSTTLFDKFNTRIKNHPLLARLMILGMILIAVSSFTNAAKNLWGLIAAAPARPEINGQWRAEVPYDWQKTPFVEIFNFSGEGEELHGSVSFLGIQRNITQGQVSSARLQFTMEIKEVAGDWNNPKLALYRYQGKILPDEIKFSLQIEGSTPHSLIEFSAKR